MWAVLLGPRQLSGTMDRSTGWTQADEGGWTVGSPNPATTSTLSEAQHLGSCQGLAVSLEQPPPRGSAAFLSLGSGAGRTC